MLLQIITPLPRRDSDWSLNTGYKLEYWLNTGNKLPSMKSPRCYQDAIREPRNGIQDAKNETARISINFAPKDRHIDRWKVAILNV